MDPDKRLKTAEVRVQIIKIDVSNVPLAYEALMLAFEQLLTCTFESSNDRNGTFAVLRNKIDELDQVTPDEEMLALGYVIAAKINQFGLSKLEYHTASGCENIVNHFMQLMTINAPSLDITDLEETRQALRAHMFSPSNNYFRSPTDRVAGNDRGFYRGQIAQAT